MLGKFWMLDARYDALMKEVNEPGVSVLFRAQGFLRYASAVLRLFDAHPELERVKLISGVTPEINKEVNIDVRLRHHFSLIAEGADIGLDTPLAVDDFVMDTLPYHTMGPGVFEIARNQAWVQTYLGLADSVAGQSSYLQVLQEITQEMDVSFGNIRVYHDLGLRSKG